MWDATRLAYVPSYPCLTLPSTNVADLILYQTALLIGEKCAVLTAEDLGYSGPALEMKVPTYHAPGEIVDLARL